MTRPSPRRTPTPRAAAPARWAAGLPLPGLALACLALAALVPMAAFGPPPITPFPITPFPITAAHAAPAPERTGVLSLRRFELLDHLSGAAESREINAYLSAVADSLEITNSYLAGSGQPRLFCPDRPLDVATLRGLLRERIAFLGELGGDTEAIKARSGVVIVLLQALRERHPCR